MILKKLMRLSLITSISLINAGTPESVFNQRPFDFPWSIYSHPVPLLPSGSIWKFQTILSKAATESEFSKSTQQITDQSNALSNYITMDNIKTLLLGCGTAYIGYKLYTSYQDWLLTKPVQATQKKIDSQKTHHKALFDALPLLTLKTEAQQRALNQLSNTFSKHHLPALAELKNEKLRAAAGILSRLNNQATTINDVMTLTATNLKATQSKITEQKPKQTNVQEKALEVERTLSSNNAEINRLLIPLENQICSRSLELQRIASKLEDAKMEIELDSHHIKKLLDQTKKMVTPGTQEADDLLESAARAYILKLAARNSDLELD